MSEAERESVGRIAGPGRRGEWGLRFAARKVGRAEIGALRREG